MVTDIIGIAIDQETKTARVRFSYESVQSPFYILKKNRSNCEAKTNEATANFMLYDSGWKMEDVVKK